MTATDTTLGDANANTIVSDGRPAPSPDAELGRGATLGRYLVLAPLGAGGMGVVYAAYDPELDRKVAIKLWHAQSSAATSADLARGRLQREAQALARLAHPNVVAVFDVGTLDGRLFVAMEYIDGWTLTDWLAIERRTIPQILEVFLAAGRGLAAAHASGLVHRDIKPDNLMIGRDGRVRVMDFGLARTAGTNERPDVDAPLGLSALDSHLTATGGLLGTPAYMSPEQFHRVVSDARGDQFSFCVSLYEALHGERPFAGSTLVELAHNVVTGRIGAPPRGTPIPPKLRRAVLRGLQPDPADRFPSMTELLAELAYDPAARRRRWLLGGLAATALAGAALGLSVLKDSSPCDGAEAPWAAVWNPARADEVGAALLATGRPHAVATAARVRDLLDHYGGEWSTMRRDTCLTHQRGEQSDTLLDLRMRCLAERLPEVDALASQLGTADAAMVDRAVQATTSLTPLSACADAEALAAAVPPPTDPATRATVEALRTRLAEVESMLHLGLFRRGRPLAEAVLRDSQATGYGPLISNAARVTAALTVNDGDPIAAQALLFTAIDVAAAARDLEAHARAWVALTSLSANSLGRPEDARRWSRAMTAAVQLLPASPVLLAAATKAQADALSESGDLAAAIPVLEQARALTISAHGPDDAQVAEIDNRLGTLLRELDRRDEARVVFERALAVSTRALGEHHPRIAGNLINLANLDTDAERYPEARQRMVQAQGLRVATLGEDHFLVAQTRYNVANIDRLLGDRAAARRGAEAALAAFERALGPDHGDVAFALDFVATLAIADGRLGDAEPLLTRSLKILEATLGHDHPDLGSPLINLGALALARKRPDDAHALYTRLLAIDEKALGPRHPDLVYPLIGLARVALLRDQPRTALPLAERALALVNSRNDLALPREEATYLVAASLRAVGRDLPRARSLAETARTTLPPGPESDPLRREIDDLLTRL